MKTNNPMEDRNYYRMLSNYELVEKARQSGDELALVLAERVRSEVQNKRFWNN